MIYVVLSIVVLLAVFGPNLWVRWVVRKYHAERPDLRGTGGELAQHLVERFALAGVTVEQTDPFRDHYDPGSRTVRLSPDVYTGKSLSAVAIATHEVGHAIQHHSQDRRLELRTRLGPAVEQLGRLSVFAISLSPLLGLLTRHPAPVSLLIALGLVGMVGRVALHVVTLPIELDASFGKALPILQAGEYVDKRDLPATRKILRAAAYTYAAAALSDVLDLVRWALILLRR